MICMKVKQVKVKLGHSVCDLDSNVIILITFYMFKGAFEILTDFIVKWRSSMLRKGRATSCS